MAIVAVALNTHKHRRFILTADSPRNPGLASCSLDFPKKGIGAKFYVPDALPDDNQLLLKNPRNAFRGQSKVTKHGTIPYVRYGFLLVYYRLIVTLSIRCAVFDIRL